MGRWGGYIFAVLIREHHHHCGGLIKLYCDVVQWYDVAWRGVMWYGKGWDGMGRCCYVAWYDPCCTMCILIILLNVGFRFSASSAITLAI